MKKVILTGGASGMGRATALVLAKSGYFVYSLDIKQNPEVECTFWGIHKFHFSSSVFINYHCLPILVFIVYNFFLFFLLDFLGGRFCFVSSSLVCGSSTRY